MSDDSAARRDAWRDAQSATTVTGDRVHDRVPPKAHEGEDIHLPDTAQVPTPHGGRNTLTRADGQFADPVDEPVGPYHDADSEAHREAYATHPQYRLQTQGVVRDKRLSEVVAEEAAVAEADLATTDSVFTPTTEEADVLAAVITATDAPEEAA